MKKIIWILLSAALLLVLAMPVSAATAYVYDEADVIPDAEEASINATLAALREKHGMDFVVWTTNAYDGNDRETEASADDFYDYGGFSPDGILMAIFLGENDRYVHLSTAGSAIRAFSNARIDDVLDACMASLRTADYAAACYDFASAADRVLDRSVEWGGESLGMDWTSILFIAAIVGLIVTIIVISAMKRKMKTVRFQTGANCYEKKGSFAVTRSRDLFLYQHTTRVPKPKDNGGSSTHRSSSGVSHGGGGRHF